MIQILLLTGLAMTGGTLLGRALAPVLDGERAPTGFDQLLRRMLDPF